MAADNTFVHTDCHNGLQGTIRWEGLQMQRNSNGHKTATLQVSTGLSSVALLPLLQKYIHSSYP